MAVGFDVCVARARVCLGQDMSEILERVTEREWMIIQALQRIIRDTEIMTGARVLYEDYRIVRLFSLLLLKKLQRLTLPAASLRP